MSRMPKIEQVAEDYELPEGGLCLGKNGWLPTLEEVQIQMPPGMQLSEALEALWAQHQGLLGEGEVIFKEKGKDPFHRGYVVFEPV